ncbi:interleukin-20 receptor subunit alpha-like [Pristis pectinata]|uniref:interleukin-20 receptor subunit alpha-like n=1 Tax=Pristis pectinata TaxID=685728 RepID=UPI00223E47EB|nr:interleukin-20 receptor subunit alpha-like [Pristis pectinata]
MFRTGLFPVTLLILLAETANSKRSTLPAPIKVHFLSTNLQNVLHWEVSTMTGSGKQHFSVQYKVYGESDWKIKAECQNITKTYCDLSNETDDYKEYYYARVRSVSEVGFSNWIRSGRFNPEVETKFTPPKVKLEAGVCSILITLTPPKKWQDNHHVQSISLTKILHELKFEVLVINKKTNKSWTFMENGEIKKVDTLEHDTTYCVTAWSVEHSTFRKSGPSETQCTTTPKDPTKQMVKIILFGCVMPIFIFIFLFALMCCFMYKYVNASDQKQPINLLQHGYPLKKTFLFFSPESLTINVMVLENGSSRISSHGCIDADDCRIPLTSQFSNESANEWKATPLVTKSEKSIYQSQTVESPTTENRAGGKERDVPISVQFKQSGPSNENEKLKGTQSEDIATENISHPQQLQNVQLPSETYGEPLQSGYKSQMPSQPLISKQAQDHVEYAFLAIDTCLNPKYEQLLHSPNGKAEDPQQMSYLSQSLANDPNTGTKGSEVDWAKVGSHDAQHGRVYLPRMPLEQEQSNYKSQFQPQPLAGKPPMDDVDQCPIVLDSNILNEEHHNEVEGPDLTVLDWDFSNSRLTLSALHVRRDSENSDSLSETIEQQNSLLSSVCTKAFPDVSLKTEEEACLSNFQEHWGLCIQV